MNELAVPAVLGVVTPLTTNRDAVCAWTTMPVWLPLTVDFAVSVAVTDWVPAVLSTTPLVKVWMP